jgi:hypothetical protein
MKGNKRKRREIFKQVAILSWVIIATVLELELMDALWVVETTRRNSAGTILHARNR